MTNRVPPLNLTPEELSIALALVDPGEMPGFVMEQGLEAEYESLRSKLRDAQHAAEDGDSA